MAKKKVSTTIYPTPAQARALKVLSQLLGRPVASFVREGIDLVLAHGGAPPAAPASPTATVHCTIQAIDAKFVGDALYLHYRVLDGALAGQTLVQQVAPPRRTP